MKQETGDSGLFERMTRLVTHNFTLKVLSLALALIIYHTMKPSNDWRSRDVEATVTTVQNALQTTPTK